MTFVVPAQSNETQPANNRAGNTNREPRTTVAYVNAYIPLKDGTRVKLFSDLTLRLYAEKPAEAQLVELIKSGQISAEQIAKLIQVEISLARDENAPIEIDLSNLV